MKRKINAIITREGDGYVARCSDVPDAIGRGKSKEDALDQLREFLRWWLDANSDDHAA